MSFKFVSDKISLLDVILPALHASSAKTTLPVLEGLLFTLKEQTLTVCGYDLEKGIRTETIVYGSGEGSVVINAQKIAGIIKSFPEGEITIECEDNFMVNIVGGMSDFYIHGIDGTSFPTIPELTGENRFTVQASKLKEMIQSTSYAVSQVDSRPFLTGEYFEIQGDSLTVVASDNFRLALTEEKGIVNAVNQEYKFIVPGKALTDLIRLIDDEIELITVEFTRKYIIFKCSSKVLFSRLLDGEYFNYKNTIPKEGKTFVKVNRRDLIECVERASLIVDEKLKTALRCKFSDNYLEINCATQYGKVSDRIKIEMEGEDIEIGFNNRYLLDALRTIKDELVLLTMFSPLMAMVITSCAPKEGERYLSFVLPRRFEKERQ